MKRIAIISTPVILLLLLFGSVQNKATAQVEEQVSYQTFYDELAPYGNWIDYPEYGYVWRPDMGADFRPYSTNGHWVWTDEYEWMWVSDYSWGWAPFHYGRWFYDDYYGWLWMPGYDWSPAWVCWRSGGDYYGWAPLGPQFNVGVSLSFGNYSPPSNYWCFVDRQYIASPQVYSHCYGVQRNVTFISNTTIINNYHRERNVYVTGPGRHEVERYTRQTIRPVGIRDVARPGRSSFRNNEVAIYRPRVNRDNNRYAPERVQRFSHDQRNEVADNRGNRFGGNNDRPGNNRDGFEQRRQQQEQMIRQRNDDANNRRQFEERQQREQMTRQRNAEAENNRRQFEDRRQQQEQMMRQRNDDANNRRQFEERQQREQLTRQRNAEAENNRRQFEERRQQPQFERRNPVTENRPNGGFGGGQQNGGNNRDRGDRGQGHGGWRHN
ncbi:hypothetical protein A4H97_12865 [Niastella yeongjuensis]|uniref:Uncharacterized protein n=1 Tax=Niastella yeongjuensis TaxID=354355 RepID=A0A1V9EAB6_9BACT|nr:DUF6600 domain-containing protein [Niastella yeongjuensis]OQP43032.1 hypothetical protein A4H97_12865 [Niastella yeongjuensis]SEO63889.1 hypothetical protein SAMN05660816_03244 [Niastella yeongjuensis]